MSKKIFMAPALSQTAEIVVGVVYSELKGITSQTLLNKIDLELSYYVQGYQFSGAYKNGFYDSKTKTWKRWDGKNHLFKNGKFLTGLLDRVESILKNNNISYNLLDTRPQITAGKSIPISNIESRQYQDRVAEACSKYNTGVVKSATGSGKSIMIANLIARTNVKTMLYVIGIDLLYQMAETLHKVLKIPIGMIGDGVADIKRVNICTVWSAASALDQEYESFDDEDPTKPEKFNKQNKEKIVEAIRSAEMTVYDECQMLAAKTLQSINLNSKSAVFKFGFSGTPFREDNSDLLLEAVCGKTIVEVTASELIVSGYLVKPKIQFLEIPECCDIKPSDNYTTIYKKCIVENEFRNQKIVNVIQKLHKCGRPPLVLVKTIKHGEILLSMLPEKLNAHFVRGSVDSATRNKIRQDFLKGKIDVIIASAVYDQGIDLPSLKALVLAGSGKSKGRALQRIGRVIRADKKSGKKDAIVIDFLDNSKYLKNHSYSRLETYRMESGFEIKLQSNPNNISKPKIRKDETW